MNYADRMVPLQSYRIITFSNSKKNFWESVLPWKSLWQFLLSAFGQTVMRNFAQPTDMLHRQALLKQDAFGAQPQAMLQLLGPYCESGAVINGRAYETPNVLRRILRGFIYIWANSSIWLLVSSRLCGTEIPNASITTYLESPTIPESEVLCRWSNYSVPLP